MSTVKDVAEHCGETIHRLRALIAAEAGEDGTELTADTIGELRGLTVTLSAVGTDEPTHGASNAGDCARLVLGRKLDEQLLARDLDS